MVVTKHDWQLTDDVIHYELKGLEDGQNELTGVIMLNLIRFKLQHLRDASQDNFKQEIDVLRQLNAEVKKHDLHELHREIILKLINRHYDELLACDFPQDKYLQVLSLLCCFACSCDELDIDEVINFVIKALREDMIDTSWENAVWDGHNFDEVAMIFDKYRPATFGIDPRNFSLIVYYCDKEERVSVPVGAKVAGHDNCVEIIF